MQFQSKSSLQKQIGIILQKSLLISIRQDGDMIFINKSMEGCLKFLFLGQGEVREGWVWIIFGCFLCQLGCTLWYLILFMIQTQQSDEISEHRRQISSLLPNPNLSQPSISHPINYITQYFAITNNAHFPEIYISMFYKKSHQIRQMFVEKINNPKEYLIRQYPVNSIIKSSRYLQNIGEGLEEGLKRLNSFSYQFGVKKVNVQELYFGELDGQRKEGYGILAEFSVIEGQPSFHFYEGYFHNNLKNGFGFEYTGNEILIGTFVDNSLFSLDSAVILYNNGDVYLGGAVNNKRSGRGCLLRPKAAYNRTNQFIKFQASRRSFDYQQMMIGDWKGNKLIKKKDGLINTSLKQIFTKSINKLQANLMIKAASVYCGDFIEVRQQQMENRRSYVKDGKGFQYFCNGDFYKGDYKKDESKGFGQYVWKNGDEYIGDFSGGKREGNGIWKGINGQNYEGEFQNDKISGYGVYKWQNGDRYEGEFREDLRSGLGKMKWKNGQEYIGHWLKGVQHGKGQLRITIWQHTIHKSFNFDKGIPKSIKDIVSPYRNNYKSQDHLKRSKLKVEVKGKPQSTYNLNEHKKEKLLQKLEDPLSQTHFQKEKKAFEESRSRISWHLTQLKKKKKSDQDQSRKEKSINLHYYVHQQKVDNRHFTPKHINNSPLKKIYHKSPSMKSSEQTFPLKKRLLKSKTELDEQKMKNEEQYFDRQDKRSSQDEISKKGLTEKISKLKRSKLMFKRASNIKEQLKGNDLGQTLLRPIKWHNFKQQQPT